MRGFVYSILIALVLTGCGTSKPPVLNVQVDNKPVPAFLHGYSWDGGVFSKAFSVTPIGTPLEVAQKIKPIIVRPEQKLTLHFNSTPQSLQLTLWKNSETEISAITDNNTISMPKEKGIYVYQLISKWKDGMASYVFSVLVEE